MAAFQVFLKQQDKGQTKAAQKASEKTRKAKADKG
jgi:hypothetical protein